MKKIYIVLTHTGTMLSKIIKTYTKDEFSHVSISLDNQLEEMYSFGRLNPYNPFWGGFVHEYIDKGTFKRFYKTQSKIYEIEINDNQYKDLKKIINNIELKSYKFNVIGLFAAGFNRKIKKEKSFYCAEFIKYLINKSNIDIKLPEVIKPEDFNNIEKGRVVYKGLLREYRSRKD